MHYVRVSYVPLVRTHTILLSEVMCIQCTLLWHHFFVVDLYIVDSLASPSHAAVSRIVLYCACIIDMWQCDIHCYIYCCLLQIIVFSFFLIYMYMYYQGVIQDFEVEGGNEKSNQKMLLKKGQLLFQYPAMDTQSYIERGGGNWS